MPRLPASKSWQEVVELLRADAMSPAVVAQAAQAAQRSFANAVDDPVYAEAVRILVAVASAGGSESFVARLNRVGVTAPPNATLMDLLVAVGDQLDQSARNGSASDLGELARRALLRTIYEQFEAQMPGLFEEQAGDVEMAARRFSEPAGFSLLARAFFTRMTAETLAYWLERTLSSEFGSGRAFASLSERAEFDLALGQFSSEATRIIKEFCAGWYAKNAHSAAGEPATRAFAAIAFKKINDELRRKVGQDA